MDIKKNLTDFLSIIYENRFFASLSLLLAIFSFFRVETILKDIWGILGIYATILSILISATYISAQVAISAFGTNLWKNYANDKYIKFYVHLFPLIFILGAILCNMGSNPNLDPNISNLFVLEFIKKNIIDYGLFGLLLGIFTFFTTFSLFGIPNYLKHIMNILNPENIILTELKQIITSKKYGENEKKILNNIEDIFKELNRKGQHITTLECLKLLYGERLKTISNTNLDNFEGFLNDYSLLLNKICLMNYPENYEDDIKVSAILGLETISRILISNNQNTYCQIIRIHEIMQDTIKKYSPNRRLIDGSDYYSELILQPVTMQCIRSFKLIKLKLLENDKFDNLKTIFTDSCAISRLLIFKLVEFYSKLDEETQFQSYNTQSCWIFHIIEMINEDIFKIIEESENEKGINYLINYLMEFYDGILITKGFNYKIGLNYLFEREHKLLANSFCELINILESKKYVSSLDSVLNTIVKLEDKSNYIIDLFNQKSYFYQYELKTRINHLELIKLMRNFIKNKEKNPYNLLITIWKWKNSSKNFLEHGNHEIKLKDLDKLYSNEYFKKWVAENKYENRVEECKKLLSSR